MNRKFVYELPFDERKSLCRLLDATDKWEELGGAHMGVDYLDLLCMRKKTSPTDELLNLWGNQNHTIDDLFILLSKMQHYRAMSLLKKLVNEKYHHLLREGEELMSVPAVQGGPREPVALQERSLSVSKSQPEGAVGPPPNSSCEDNKDLGLDALNINCADQKVRSKNLPSPKEQSKIQNIETPENRREMNGRATPQPVKGCVPTSGRPSPQSVQERKFSGESIKSSVRSVEYSELEKATNFWDTRSILGKGGFGTVYKGTWKNTLVAVKKLDSEKDNQPSKSNPNQMPQSMRELNALNSHRHDNILCLYGYSVHDNTVCLVYQFMANGSLEDRLLLKQGTPPLDWEQRLKIMTGTARGIQFLHSQETPLVHGDIKSANILLDESLNPRIGDFGLAREGPHKQYTHKTLSRVHGTKPYLPEEFLRNKQFSVNVDTYSFGVVLFEVATGKRAYDSNTKQYLKDYVKNLDHTEYSSQAAENAGPDLVGSASGLITLGRDCVKPKPKERPKMEEVLTDMEKLYQNYKDAVKAIRSAPENSLTPTSLSPVQLQAVYDQQRITGVSSPMFFRNVSPTPHQSPWVYPHVSQTNRVLGYNQHHPPTLMVQPPSTHSTNPSNFPPLSLPPSTLTPSALCPSMVPNYFPPSTCMPLTQPPSQLPITMMPPLMNPSSGLPHTTLPPSMPPPSTSSPPKLSPSMLPAPTSIHQVHSHVVSSLDESGNVPNLSMLNNSPSNEKQGENKSSMKEATQETTESSIIQSSASTESSLGTSEASGAAHQSSFSVSLPTNDTDSGFLPKIPEFLGIKQASG